MWRNTSYMADKLGVSVMTINRWYKQGRFDKTMVTTGGHYRIWEEQDEKYYLYIRTENASQDLVNKQATILKKEVPYGEVITDISSGLNFDRPGLTSILERALSGYPCHVIATTQDVVATAGFHFIERIITLAGGSVRVLEEPVCPDSNFKACDFIGIFAKYYQDTYAKG
jgi:excisionase family DNA binding protein